MNNHIPVASAEPRLVCNRGLLGHCQHTSNDLEYTKTLCPTYNGESFYQQQPAVVDGDLITASGVAALDFAYAVLKKLEVFLPATLDAWYQLYQTHDAAYFFALMNSLPPAE